MNYYDLISKPEYIRLAGTLALLCFIGMAGMIFFVLSNISVSSDKEKQIKSPPWSLLMGTWRDSLLVSVLYLCVDLSYRATGFMVTGLQHGASGSSVVNLLMILSPFLELFLIILMAIIVISRVMIIQKWLKTEDA